MSDPTVGEVWSALNRIADAVRADDREEYMSAVEAAVPLCTAAQIKDAFWYPARAGNWPSFPMYTGQVFL